MRVLNAGMFVVMLFSAAVQLNDPDPLLWIFAYGMSAILCVAFHTGHLTARVALVYVVTLAAIAGVTALQGGGEVSMGWGPTWGPLDHEVVRELLGLTIAATWIAVIGVAQARRETRTASDRSR